MNKLKLMYDVVKTMKDKEILTGTLQAEGRKAQEKVFGFANEFSKNTVTGENRIKLNTEFDWNGQKMKHESATEWRCGQFKADDCRGRMHAGMMRHLHGHPGMAGQGFGHGPFHPQFGHGMHCGGFKEGLGRIGFLLQVLNNIQLEEKADQSVVLSLNGNDFPEEFRQAIRERMKCHEEMRSQMRHRFETEVGGDDSANPARPAIPGMHGFLKELHEVENPAFNLRVTVNKNNEVVQAVLEFSGQRKDEKQELSVKAELSFVW